MKHTLIILIILNIIASVAITGVCESVEGVEPEDGPEFSEEVGTEGFLRLHIRANSDSEEDQALKIKVRDKILEYTSKHFKDIASKEDAMVAVQSNLDEIEAVALAEIEARGYDYDVNAEINREEFEYREYDGFYLPAAEYDSLIINIGSGEGQNWWCVIFPAVCLSGSVETETNTDDNTDAEVDEEDSVEVSVNIDAVPEQYRLSETPAPENVKYELWIVKFFKNLFS